MSTIIKEKRERRKSNAFTSLTQTQISEIREAFDILDADDDKKITKSDLINFSEKFQNLNNKEIDEMLTKLHEPTYISLLSFFADHLGSLDDESILKSDLHNLVEYGKLKEEDLCNKLDINESDRRLIFKDISQNGEVNISQLCVLLKHGELLGNKSLVTETNIYPNL